MLWSYKNVPVKTHLWWLSREGRIPYVYITYMYMHTVVTTVIPRSLQFCQVFLPAVLGKITTITRCLSTTYMHHQHAHESIERPVHDLLQPPGIRSTPQAQGHNGMDVAVVKLDQLINWSRKVSRSVLRLWSSTMYLRMHGKAVWPLKLWQVVPVNTQYNLDLPTLCGHIHY